MGIRLEDLPLNIQEQIAKKELHKRRSKYRSEKAKTNGITFDSRAEQRRYLELISLYRKGMISDLKVHPQFTLLEGYVKPTGERVQRMQYTADFSYMQAGELVVEDVKSRPTRTTDYKMRKKLMLDKYGISIKEIT